MLLTLTMLLASLAGCAGDDDNPSPLVGEWWEGDTMIVHFIENGTYNESEGFRGTWSTDGDTFTIIHPGQGAVSFNFTVEGDWMWIRMLADNGTAYSGDCQAFHPEGISDDEYDDRVSELTPPSFC